MTVPVVGGKGGTCIASMLMVVAVTVNGVEGILIMLGVTRMSVECMVVLGLSLVVAAVGVVVAE